MTAVSRRQVVRRTSSSSWPIPLRWRLLRELTRSDRAVSELTDRVGEPQNLVSYHLRRLRDGGLVSTRRSAADRRGTYYAIDLAGL